MAEKKGAKLTGPLYTAPTKSNLGPQEVGGPTGGKSVPDPLNFVKKGSKGT